MGIRCFHVTLTPTSPRPAHPFEHALTTLTVAAGSSLNTINCRTSNWTAEAAGEYSGRVTPLPAPAASPAAEAGQRDEEATRHYSRVNTMLTGSREQPRGRDTTAPR